MKEALNIIVVERSDDRAAQIVEALTAVSNLNEIHVVSDVSTLTQRVAALAPDVVLIDVADPSRDMLEELALASGPIERPVAMFVDQSSEGLTAAAIEAGFSAYVVDGLNTNRLKPVLEATIARFRMMQRMRKELAETKRALEERKVIDRAKGLIMTSRAVSEEEAYAILRKAAMDQNRRVADVAEALVSTAGLLS
ncbi:MAG: ANTAR domain-containing protein [Pseudomonadota bacterium]